jgi:hypothetical protein
MDDMVIMRKTVAKAHHVRQTTIFSDFAYAAVRNNSTIKNSAPVEKPWLIC